VAYPDDRQFDTKILKCIDTVLSTFGDSPRLLLYYIVVKECYLPKDQFPSKPDELSTCLTKILGETGYRFIEMLTIREIQKEFGVSIKQGSSLSQAIDQAKDKFLTC
jgi:hypothetical protein